MKVENLKDRSDRMARRSAGLVALLGISLIANAGMAVTVASVNKVILVPTLVDTVEVSSRGGVDRDYLERLSRDVIYTFLNRTPETARYFERQLERITSPRTYQELRQALIADRQERQNSRSSQVFHPNEFFVDPSKLYVEVTGELQTISGTEVSERERVTYGLTFERTGSQVLLSSIVPLERKDARGQRAPIVREEDL